MLFACLLLAALPLLILRSRRLSRGSGKCFGCPYAEECRKQRENRM